MKKQIIILLTILTFSNCTKTISNRTLVNPEKYITVEYIQYESNGKINNIVLPKFLEINDSIGKFIKNYPRRFSYFLGTEIKPSELNILYPDTISIKKLLNSKISKKQFLNNFNKLIEPNKLPKQTFTKDELMLIASRFFYVVKFRDGSIGTRVCSGQNGIDNLKNDKEYRLLETLVFEAIFNEITQKKDEKMNFMNNLDKYVETSIELNKEITSDSLVVKVRSSIFKSMENDIDLKEFLSKYIKNNMNNIPFKIID